MMIRDAKEKDIPRILKLLEQVLQIHADIRPDIFIPGTTKYTIDELREILSQYLLQWMKRMFVWGMHFANYRSSLFQTIRYHLSRSISMICVLIKKHGASILVKVCLNM